ncbi:hypothetical protein SDC9_154750 [bioreactor metagenome]|uniref:Uncharacterized protein n=1 Tax=bioreactor metagenome TaxID=1076179 RepID=A0A645F150_9ZZZZ
MQDDNAAPAFPTIRIQPAQLGVADLAPRLARHQAVEQEQSQRPQIEASTEHFGIVPVPGKSGVQRGAPVVIAGQQCQRQGQTGQDRRQSRVRAGITRFGDIAADQQRVSLQTGKTGQRHGQRRPRIDPA